MIVLAELENGVLWVSRGRRRSRSCPTPLLGALMRGEIGVGQPGVVVVSFSDRLRNSCMQQVQMPFLISSGSGKRKWHLKKHPLSN
uniref:Uncharacterized protein n=1 Tax=Arundo donax TaxID=35708 RepID=A0A0A9AFS6_ARUDO